MLCSSFLAKYERFDQALLQNHPPFLPLHLPPPSPQTPQLQVFPAAYYSPNLPPSCLPQSQPRRSADLPSQQTFRPRQLSIPSASVSSQFYPLPFGIASEPSSAVLTAYRQSPPPSKHSHPPPVQPCFPEMPVSLKLATACSPDLSESSEPAHPSLNR